MSDMPKRTKARLEFALDILERHQRNLVGLITACRAYQQTESIAALAMQTAADITQESGV